MPVETTKGGGKRWGTKGKVYYGSKATEKASRQGRAIKASQAKRGKKNAK